MRIPIRLKLVRPVILVAVLTVCVGVFGCFSGVALADEAPAGGLMLHTFAMAGSFTVGESPARCDETQLSLPKSCYGYQVTAVNAGGAASEGPIVLKEQLPSGFSVTRHRFFVQPQFHFGEFGEVQIAAEEQPGSDCVEEGEPVLVTCTFPGTLAPDEALALRLFVTVAEGAPSGQPATTTVSGPDSPEAAVSEPLAVGFAPLSFGPSSLVTYIAGAKGAPDTQAGGHPYELSTRIDLKNVVRFGPKGFLQLTSVQDVKDILVDLPMGLLGDAQAAEKCKFSQLETFVHCPPGSKVGQVNTQPEGGSSANTGIFNMVPEHGVAAEFGFVDTLDSTHAIYASVAPTPAGYVLRAVTREVPQVTLTNATATFFGDPATRDGTGSSPVAMFTNPSDCSTEPLISTVRMDSWQEPGPYASNATPQGEPEVNGANWLSAVSNEWPVGGTVTPATASAVTGCNLLHFSPSAFTFAPEEAHSQADEPSGYESVLRIPQTETPGTLATPPLKTAVVTLPPGVAVSPSAADGLQGCSAAQFGFKGVNQLGIDEMAPGPGACPAASTVGKVEVLTPLLGEPLTGTVFVAQPACGGSGQPECTEEMAEAGGVFALYMEVGSENTGIHVKLRGKVEVGGNGQYSQTHGLQPGQVRTSFIKTPQVAVFSELRLKFNGGPRAPLANPQTCGTFTTNANLEPWSAPESGPNAIEEPSFNISGCENRFAPSFSAGTVNNQAGGYSAFTTTFTRQDREQDLSGVTVNMPEGLLGKIAGIEQRRSCSMRSRCGWCRWAWS